MRRLAALIVSLAAANTPAGAQEQSITLAAPAELVESGFLRYVLPRFSLKHGVRVSLAEPGATADVALVSNGADGRPVFSGEGRTYRVVVASGESDSIEKFTDWLSSKAGLSAIGGFTVDGATPFGPPLQTEVAVAEISYDGNAAEGATLSLGLCGRCHVVGEVNRLSGIGSTPSFGVLRTMADWEERFVAFYILKPHAAFTQVADVTAPFAPESPSPIAPIEMTLDDLDNIVAYVAQIPPTDLGAPIEHQ